MNRRIVIVGAVGALALASSALVSAQRRTVVIDDGVQYCVGVGVAVECVEAADVKRLISERSGGQRSLADSALEQLAATHDELAQARLERSTCETTLGPLEARARRSDSEARWREIKRLIEEQHPGYDYDTATRRLAPKPPPKAEKQ